MYICVQGSGNIGIVFLHVEEVERWKEGENREEVGREREREGEGDREKGRD